LPLCELHEAPENAATRQQLEGRELNKLLRNANGQIRNGWWILIFAAIFIASQFVYRPVSKGLQHIGLDKTWLEPLPVVFLLLITWICLRLRRQGGLASVGLSMDAAWLRQLLAGIAFGGVEMLALVALILLAGGVQFELDPARGLAALGLGAWSFAWAALIEELLFRGFVFQRLVDGIGAPLAVAVMAALFALAHWGNPGMEGGTLVAASIDTALGAAMLGLAWLRTGSLALPIGIHFGWNWVQGSVLGFGVSGFAQAGWLHPHLMAKPQWLTGGAFGPEASVFSIVVDVVAIALLWRWKGTSRAARVTRVPVPA
jgi:membrane protease YdiL (CAAX protease family)